VFVAALIGGFEMSRSMVWSKLAEASVQIDMAKW